MTVRAAQVPEETISMKLRPFPRTSARPGVNDGSQCRYEDFMLCNSPGWNQEILDMTHHDFVIDTGSLQRKPSGQPKGDEFANHKATDDDKILTRESSFWVPRPRLASDRRISL
jgi:hypothetical protein